MNCLFKVCLVSRDPALCGKGTSGNISTSPCVCLGAASGSASSPPQLIPTDRVLWEVIVNRVNQEVRNSTWAHTKTILLVIVVLAKYI